MKVLLVTHLYPPGHTAGTEQYTAQLARGLTARGHEVAVFTSEKDVSRAHLSASRRVHEGVPVFEFVNNLEYAGFRETWELPAAEAAFDAVLEEFAPDLVHVQHLLNLSTGLPEVAKRRGLPVAFTLHDYWLQCARFGQRVHADTSLCREIDESRCAECLGSLRYRNSALEQTAGRWLAKLRGISGVDLAAPARRVGDWLRSKEPAGEVPPLPIEEVEARGRALRERLPAAVDRFLSPSAFLRDELVRWGLPAAKVQHLRTGTDLARFAGGERAPRGAELRLGFLGSLIPVKGPHLLLEAYGALPDDLRERASLALHGPEPTDLGYRETLRELAACSGATLGGPLDRAGVADALRRLDLLIVPSLWFENQPLVILEALAARTPLAVSDLGGMAELVEPGVSGFRFPLGDAAALSGLLGDLIRAPERLDGLYRLPVALPSVDDQLDAVEQVYRELTESRA